MLRKLLPILLSVVAFLGGAAAGDMLTAAPTAAQAEGHAGSDAAAAGEHGAAPAAKAAAKAAAADHAAPAADAHAKPATPAKPASPSGKAGDHGGGGHGGGSADPTATAWFKFPAQFFVPILHDGRLDSTMVLTLSAEMPGAATETVYAHEIKLRDALLRQLLIHANTGGFDGNFTSEAHLRGLRTELAASAQAVVPEISAILIGDIARQER